MEDNLGREHREKKRVQDRAWGGRHGSRNGRRGGDRTGEGKPGEGGVIKTGSQR